MRQNPLISLVLEKTEYERLKRISLEEGVSIAQISRGALRLSLQKINFDTHKTKRKRIIRLGQLRAA